MEFTTTIWGTIIAMALFTAIGAWLFAKSVRLSPAERAARREERGAARGLADAMRRYVGPVSPDVALLSPVKRVALEFVSALCGFPGFGWLASTRVAIGLPLLCIGPAIVYGFYPAFLAMTGRLSDSPYVALEYLPFLAIVSASALAVAEVRTARSGRDAS